MIWKLWFAIIIAHIICNLCLYILAFSFDVFVYKQAKSFSSQVEPSIWNDLYINFEKDRRVSLKPHHYYINHIFNRTIYNYMDLLYLYSTCEWRITELIYCECLILFLILYFFSCNSTWYVWKSVLLCLCNLFKWHECSRWVQTSGFLMLIVST